MQLIQSLPVELVVVVVWAILVFGMVNREHCCENGIAETPIVCVEDVCDALLVLKEIGQHLMCAAVWIERIDVSEMQFQPIDVDEIGK